VGWVSTQYLSINIDLNLVSVTGAAVNVRLRSPMPGGTTYRACPPIRSQIFLDGLAKGNLPHSFTKVGDSLTAAPQFLIPFGIGAYNLGNYGYLGGAISFLLPVQTARPKTRSRGVIHHGAKLGGARSASSIRATPIQTCVIPVSLRWPVNTGWSGRRWR